MADLKLSDMDFTSLEARVKALEGVPANPDIHTGRAALEFNVPYHSVTPEQRRYAKAANFHMLYSTGARKL